MSAVRAASFTLASLVLSSSALAAAPTPADREAARGLATRGFDLFQSKDYPHAIESFEKAEARIHAPPHWLYIARSHVQLGKLIAAREEYQRILAEKLALDAPQPFREAQADAKSELGEIEPKIPSIELTLTGSNVATADVQLDEKPFPASALGHAYPADPGVHTLVITVPGSPPITRAVTLKADGATERVSVDVDASPGHGTAPIVLAFSLGGLALGAGGVTLGLFLKSTPTSAGLRIASIASFAVGGLGVGTGVVLLATRPSAATPRAPAGPQVTATVGLGSIALTGTF